MQYFYWLVSVYRMLSHWELFRSIFGRSNIQPNYTSHVHLQILLCTTLKPMIAIGALILPSTIYGILKVLPLSRLSWQCDVFGLMYLGWCLTFWTCKAYSVCSMYCSCFYWCAVYKLTSDLLACVLKKGFLIWKHFACSKLGPLLSTKLYIFQDCCHCWGLSNIELMIKWVIEKNPGVEGNSAWYLA